MRGLAAVLAGAAAWIAVSGWTPPLRLPRPNVPSPWVVPAAVATGTAAGLLALGLLAVPAASIAIAALAASAPVVVDAARSHRQRESLAEAWPDFLALLKGRVAAGATLPDAFIAAARLAPEPLASAARQVEESVSFGDGFTPALERLRHQLDDATSDRVLATLSFAHRSGGHRVGTVISSLGVSISDELRLRRAHAAALTEQRMTATVALVAPWALLSLTIATNPQAAAAYRTTTGSLVIAIGFAATGLGFIAARRSARLSGAPRVLR
ncbi:MAG: type II secretion system F family protein [Actinomycetota bacterium]|nr:type II secretion system F family protein [Actinomycetota bacterium]